MSAFSKHRPAAMLAPEERASVTTDAGKAMSREWSATKLRSVCNDVVFAPSRTPRTLPVQSSFSCCCQSFPSPPPPPPQTLGCGGESLEGPNPCLLRTKEGHVARMVRCQAAHRMSRMRTLPERYTPHSFRIGAATEAAVKVLTATLKAMGRWSSDAYERFIRLNTKDILAVLRVR